MIRISQKYSLMLLKKLIMIGELMEMISITRRPINKLTMGDDFDTIKSDEHLIDRGCFIIISD